MSRQTSRFLQKARSKIFNGFKCTKGNVSSILEETLEIGDTNENSSARSSLQFLDSKSKVLNTITSKKRAYRIESDDEDKENDSNISQLPILVLTPEKKRNKFSSTFVERQPIESFMTEDLTCPSPTMSSICCMENHISDSLITNDMTTINGTEFAFSNILYQSPVIAKRSFQSLLTEDSMESYKSYQDTTDLITEDFQTAYSINSNKLDKNSNEIFI
ncbi:unnamed protein product [Brachionus calyciflorus]|uniref:Uncharacterized protein n=1 Tax=Brachionus calyciflorus TaxID=104777 RepID=A0A814M0X0_9BILA|nr:unnamed protein product [Brachionus calyciflorus]